MTTTSNLTELAPEGFVTSYAGLFRPRDGRPGIRGIEIPIIQRDYAQGRSDARASTVRASFLAALHGALVGGQPLSLDFVYGEIDSRGMLIPLDGQQRLTTLFLMHWYLASRTGQLDAGADWSNLTYATRPGAGLFCERLARTPAPGEDVLGRWGERPLSAWIADQAWFQIGWRHDPTVASMMQMLDTVRDVFGSDEATCATAWDGLVGEEPRITFNFLPLPDAGTGATLYVKMNSRGKELTSFEVFKARLESAVGWLDADERIELASSLDGAWSDLLWTPGADRMPDDDFMNYLGWLTEICEWREDTVSTEPIGPRTDVFGTGQRRSEHMRLVFHAFNTWLGADRRPVDVAAELDAWFAPTDGLRGGDRVVLFGRSSTNLFNSCREDYRTMRDRARAFTLGDSLLLLAVVIHRQHSTDDLARRLRSLRNLIEASVNELRPERGPDLVRDVEHLVRGDALEKIKGLNQRQVSDERRKRAHAGTPREATIRHLEDHPLLRGRLAAFDLDTDALEHRARAFDAATDPQHWPLLTAALLTQGTYGRNMANGYLRLGSPQTASWWRELFTESNSADTERTRSTLGELLDRIDPDQPIEAQLRQLCDDFVADRRAAQTYDWRAYLVGYDHMRTGRTGVYYSRDRDMGYDLCMLSTKSILGYYRDPYLEAAVALSGLPDLIPDRTFRYDVERWARVPSRGVEIRFVRSGLEIRPVDGTELGTALPGALLALDPVSVVDDLAVITVQQRDDGDGMVDTEDRIQLGATVLRLLADAEHP